MPPRERQGRIADRHPALAPTAILYHSSKNAPDVAAELAKKYGVKIQAYQCDVGDGALTKATFKKIEAELGEITGLIAVSFSLCVGFDCPWERESSSGD